MEQTVIRCFGMKLFANVKNKTEEQILTFAWYLLAYGANH